jgi:hypothetical protein
MNLSCKTSGHFSLLMRNPNRKPGNPEGNQLHSDSDATVTRGSNAESSGKDLSWEAEGLCCIVHNVVSMLPAYCPPKFQHNCLGTDHATRQIKIGPHALPTTMR